MGLLSDPSKRIQMGRAARQWVLTEFSIEAAARKTEAVYRRHLARKNRSCG
jgi:glycosyltransferase involved in cell wall biosynthesis